MSWGCAIYSLPQVGCRVQRGRHPGGSHTLPRALRWARSSNPNPNPNPNSNSNPNPRAPRAAPRAAAPQPATRGVAACSLQPTPPCEPAGDNQRTEDKVNAHCGVGAAGAAGAGGEGAMLVREVGPGVRG